MAGTTNSRELALFYAEGSRLGYSKKHYLVSHYEIVQSVTPTVTKSSVLDQKTLQELRKGRLRESPQRAINHQWTGFEDLLVTRSDVVTRYGTSRSRYGEARPSSLQRQYRSPGSMQTPI
jgi:hypothetical protein